MSNKIEAGQFLDFVKLFPMRRNRKEKAKIQENLVSAFKVYEIQPTIYEEPAGIKKIKHLFFGNLEKCELIIACGYDTAERLWMGTGDYWPFNEDRNRSKTFVNITISLALGIVLAIAAICFLAFGIKVEGVMKIVDIASAIIIALLANKLVQGLPNQSTFTKSAALFMNLILPKHFKSEKVAYLFLEYGSYSKVGIDFLKKDIFKGKKIVYLDFFGDGDTLIMANDELGARTKNYIKDNYKGKTFETLTNKTVNRFNELENIVVLSAGNIDKEGLPVIKNVRTDDDLVVDPDIMQNTFDALITLCKGVSK